LFYKLHVESVNNKSKPQDMNATLKKNWNEIEAQRKSIFNALRTEADATLNKKPAPEAWSVVQVLQHLMAAESATLAYLQKKMPEIANMRKAGFKNAYRSLLLKIALRMPFKFKAPKMTVPGTEAAALAEIEKQWEEIRMGFYVLLDNLTEEEIPKELFNHVRAGKFNVLQMVNFFGEHIARHEKQIARTLQQVKD